MTSYLSFLQRQMEIYLKNKRKHEFQIGVKIGKAKALVRNVEYVAPKFGSLAEACDMLGCTEEEYREAKEFLEKEVATE